MISWFHLRAFDCGQFFQWHRLLSFTSFHCHCASMLTHKKMFERGQQIRTQTSFLLSNSVEVAARQQHCEKFLRKIFGLIRADAFASDEGINGPPVGTAKPFERLLGGWRSALCF